MTTAELKEATALALSREDINDSIDCFDGFGLPSFTPVICTIRQLARLVRWQCVQLNGQIDNEAMQAIHHFGRKRFQIVGQ